MEQQQHPLDFVFKPKSVAVTGASPGKQGQMFLSCYINSGYKGKLYAINSRGEEVCGLKAHTSINELPEPVDFVMCCIPNMAVPQFVRDCGAKGVKVVCVFTAGFSEIGTEEGRRLELEVVRAALEAGVRIVGPNCLGPYTPSVGLSYTVDFPKESGSMAFLCQSGGNSVSTTREAAARGVRFSKVISYGNACNINECDLLEYLDQDDETEMVAIYIEGVRDGPRFHRTLTKLCERKPVVILKGGFTQAGAKAAASHTGSLAGSDLVLDGLLKQAGAIRVDSLEELVDVMVTLYLLPTPQGRRLSIVGAGGGSTVLATDDWARNGFVLPQLPSAIYEELKRSIPNEAGLILHNPVDLSMFAFGANAESFLTALVNRESFADLTVFHQGFGQSGWVPSHTTEALLDNAINAYLKVKTKTDRPLLLVLQHLISGWDWQKGVEDVQKRCTAAGIPVYHSMFGAAKAVDTVLRYHERRRKTADC
ncbi:MAG TPA: CoA-binding protein [Dehalococcoidia bacterium]|nr:CoA-binding protein [Dehalococcoidia bacterium]